MPLAMRGGSGQERVQRKLLSYQTRMGG